MISGLKQELQNDSGKWFILSVTVATLVFTLEQFTPLGIAHGFGYALLIPLVALSCSIQKTYLVGLLTIIYIWFAVWLSPAAPPGFPVAYVVINRVLSTISVIVVCYVGGQLIAKKHSRATLLTKLNQTQIETSQLIDSLPLIVWSTDSEGNIRFLNLHIGKNSTLTSPLTFESFLEELNSQERLEMEYQWKAGLAGLQRFNFSANISDSLGNSRIYRVEGVPVDVIEGRPSYWNGTLLDITDQVSLQQKNEETARKLDATLAGITDAFFILDQDMRFIYANEKAMYLLGCTTLHVKGYYLDDIISVMDDCPLIAKCRIAAVSQEVTSTTEYYPLHNMWVMQNIFPTTAGPGGSPHNSGTPVTWTRRMYCVIAHRISVIETG